MDHVHRSACPSQDVEEASEITLGRSRCVHASCKNVSGVHRRSGYFFTNYHLFVLHANNLRYIVLQVCNPSDSGEYRINCISLLIHSILRYSGYYIGEAVPSAESYKGDLWLWLVSLKPMSQLPPSQARTLPCTFPRAKHMPSTIPCTFPALVARVSSYHLSGVIEACESGDPLHAA